MTLNMKLETKSFLFHLFTVVSGQCLNGGNFDGIKCICPALYYGSQCESYGGEIITTPTFVFKKNVDMEFINLEYTESLANSESEEYEKFTAAFKTQMRALYLGLPGYKDVTIREIRPGSVIVYYYILVELQYNKSVSDDYWQMQHNVIEHIMKANNTKDNPWYFGGASIPQDHLPTVEEVCRDAVLEGFKEYYDPVMATEGLLCVSHCSSLSANYVSCNAGACVLAIGSGPSCLCSDTDSHIYTGRHCTGKISKTVLYVSLGVTIGILIMVLVILGIFCWRKKNKAIKPITEETPQYSTMK